MAKSTLGGFVERAEYLERVEKIQTAVYAGLEQNDARFEGDDGIHGVLVYGSVAESFFSPDNTTFLRRPYLEEPGSDVDLLFIEASRLSVYRYIYHLQPTDIDLLAKENRPRDLGWIIHPDLRLTCLIRSNLTDSGMTMPVEHPLLATLDIDSPVEHSSKVFSRFRISRGLLFVPEHTARREEIFDIFRASKLQVAIDPATSARAP